MNPKKYLGFLYMGLNTMAVYRLNAVTSLLNSVIFLILAYAIWGAIAAAGSLDGGLSRVMSYLVLGQVISSSIFMHVERLIGPKIRQGTIVNELKRPISFRSQTYFNIMGIALFNFLTVGLPLLLLGYLFIDISFPNLLNTAAFFLSIFLGFNLVFALSYITGMIVFWTKVDWSIRMTRQTLQELFSGAMFPLYLLPAGLGTFFNFLPFQSMVDAPISIFLMEKTGTEILWVFGKQIGWIIGLLLVGELFWRKAKKKLTVQGG